MDRRIAGVPWSVPILAATTRTIVIVVGLLAVIVLGVNRGAPPRAGDAPLSALQNRWDAGFYVGIASGGYRHAGAAQHFDDVAFFPAFPLVLRYTARLFQVPRTPDAWAWVGAVVSCVAFTIACIFLYRVASRHDRADPYFAVLLCALYPFAAFFSASYTESLFLLSCLASYDCLLRGRTMGAACLGFVAGLCRPPGWLLSLVLTDTVFRARRHRHLPSLVAAASPIAGAFTFAAYLTLLTGNPLAWTEAQARWGRHYGGLREIASSFSQRIQEHGFVGLITMWPADVMNAVAACAALASVVPIWRRLGAGQALFVASTIGLPLLFGGLTSLARFSSVLFPLFLWLSGAIRGPWRSFVLVSFASVQIVTAALFYTWRPMF